MEVNDETASSSLLGLDLWGKAATYSKRASGRLRGELASTDDRGRPPSLWGGPH